MATSIPPHNVGEICDALLLMLDKKSVTNDELLAKMPGPDFPTGGVVIDPPAAIAQSYATGRGGFTIRARWHKETLKGGTWQIVVTEIPYQIQKAKLFEKMAELVEDKKIPLIETVADESAEDVRLVIVPKSRTIDAAVMMEALFQQTDLQTRFPLNMNVLDESGRVPKLMDLKSVLRAFLDHRHEVLQRKSRHRMAWIDDRLEKLSGFIIAYLNLDRVIKIIRESDEPKPELMKAFKLSDAQAEAILNMRLRSLRKLEEMELKREHAKLSGERAEIVALLDDEKKRWKAIGGEIKTIRSKFGGDTVLGKRRTTYEEAALIDVPLETALIEKEPVTVLYSERGWIRAVKGHNLAVDDLKYKEGDEGKYALEAQTTDRLLLFGSNGRIYTIGCDRLPRGRGFGDPVRLMVDLPDDAEIVEVEVYSPGMKILMASSDGRGFIVAQDDVLAQTRAGRQVLNLEPKVTAKFCLPVTGTHVAISCNSRKLLAFKLDEIPEMARGRGVALTKKGIEPVDMKIFTPKEGLTWKSGERNRTLDDVKPWISKRAQSGRVVPEGFPRSGKFG